MKKIKLKVKGMHCASCAGNIERSLKRIPGLKNATVSMMTRKAIVEADDNVSEEEMKRAVSRAGYKVSKIEN